MGGLGHVGQRGCMVGRERMRNVVPKQVFSFFFYDSQCNKFDWESTEYYVVIPIKLCYIYFLILSVSVQHIYLTNKMFII